MEIQGLEVKGLDVVEISQILEKYVADYFNGYELSTGRSMFMEDYVLHFDEVNELIPAKHHHHFTDDSKFTCMSGYIIIDYVAGKVDERVAMLLMDEHSTYVYMLCVQEVDEKGVEKTVIIKDFMDSQ